jgi:hypothetical protein
MRLEQVKRWLMQPFVSDPRGDASGCGMAEADTTVAAM